ncbi:MAG: hypothetical protein ACKPCP_38150 [Sphaerospermopsis kisseleviana]
MPESDAVRAYRLTQIRQQQQAQPPAQSQPVIDWEQRRIDRQMADYAAVQQQFKAAYPDYIAPSTPATAAPVPMPMPMPVPAVQQQEPESRWNQGHATDHDRIEALTRLREANKPKPTQINENDPRLLEYRAQQAKQQEAQKQRSLDAEKYSRLIGRPPTERELRAWIAGGRPDGRL